jgi:hypothetical protein
MALVLTGSNIKVRQIVKVRIAKLFFIGKDTLL